MSLRRLGALALAIGLSATSCIGGGATPTTIFVDFSHDEFPSFIAKNFPRRLAVHPGSELVFKQTWTGEPHSVTGGTLVNELLEEVRPYLELEARGEEDKIPEDPPKKIEELEKNVVWAVDHESEGFDFIQTGAQPCYLSKGEPRKDGKPCKEQDQPVFTGKQSFYNSGLIPYEGPQGNEYNVQLAEDIDPGSYWFYCNFHGEFQSTEVIVKPASEKVPSAAEINRQAQREIAKVSGPFEKLYEDARKDGKVTLKEPGSDESTRVEGNFAGLYDPGSFSWHSINAFVPKRMTVDTRETITWNLLGFHTISFGVPDYFPIMTFEENGTVKRNKKLDPAAGGAKKVTLSEEELYEGEEPPKWDGGTYDGNGFWSSGTIDASPYMKYSMRISNPGTYRYACLIHPPMVGTVEVT